MNATCGSCGRRVRSSSLVDLDSDTRVCSACRAEMAIILNSVGKLAASTSNGVLTKSTPTLTDGSTQRKSSTHLSTGPEGTSGDAPVPPLIKPSPAAIASRTSSSATLDVVSLAAVATQVLPTSAIPSATQPPTTSPSPASTTPAPSFPKKPDHLRQQSSSANSRSTTTSDPTITSATTATSTSHPLTVASVGPSVPMATAGVSATHPSVAALSGSNGGNSGASGARIPRVPSKSKKNKEALAKIIAQKSAATGPGSSSGATNAADTVTNGGDQRRRSSGRTARLRDPATNFTTVHCWAVACTAYDACVENGVDNADSIDEVSLDVGDIVFLRRQYADGRCLGEIVRRVGPPPSQPSHKVSAVVGFFPEECLLKYS